MMRVKKMIIDQFKGVDHAEYAFADRTVVKGRNGSGKSTLADAYFYLFADKDYALNGNPEIHNTGLAESEPSVTAVCDFNGKEITYRKYQTDMRTKKQRMEGAPVRISNKYEINDVPTTQKDFIQALTSLGIDTDLFLMLSHTGIVTSMKNADLRKLLFGMVSDVTDMDIAKGIPACEAVARELENFTVEEISAKAKKSIKEANAQMTALPNQIIGMEKAKVPVNPDLPKEKAEIESKIVTLTEMYEEAKRATDAKVIDGRIRELETEKVKLFNDANSERLQKLSNAQSKHRDAEKECYNKSSAVDWFDMKGAACNDEYTRLSASLAEAREHLKEVKALKFTGRTKCPTCGQDLPKDRVAEAKAKFAKQKEEQVKAVETRVSDILKRITQLKEDGSKLTKEKKKAAAEKAKAKKNLDAAMKEVSKYHDPIVPDTNAIDAQIAELKKSKEGLEEAQERVGELDAAIHVEKQKLHDIIKAMAAEENNAFIDERISDMKEQQKVYAQVKANAELLLYQLSVVSAKKNEVLSEQVNSHFTRVRFRLFKTQKNGEVVDDCTPMVLCSDGEYRDMVYSANTAAVVAAKIDICSGLQAFFGQDLPIWLDGAECLDDENRKELKTKSQLIMLCVSEDKELVIE